ncbi:hypothetical protein ACNQPY_26310 [Mycobacteroides abscessus]|uniref:hypothetical protein n=1 Tax=Mycobacteroides abscessus TaxID=36809 RepID=UPI003AAC8EF9
MTASSQSWTQRVRAWIHEATRPDDQFPPEEPWSDDDVLARAELLARDNYEQGNGCVLDIPLRPAGGGSKNYIWDRAIRAIAESEARWITAYEKDREGKPPRRTTMNFATMQPWTDEEADARHADMMAWWSEHQEVPLRPSDHAAAVSVWLWRNGLRDEAVHVYGRIWMCVREEQQEHKRIAWTADAALEGFREAAYRDWDDDDQQQFAVLFRHYYVDPEIDQGLKKLA